MNRKLFSVFACIVAFTIILSGCATGQSRNESQVVSQTDTSTITATITEEEKEEAAHSATQAQKQTTTEENMVQNINLQIGNHSFTATLEENAAADAFVDMLRQEPIVIEMRDYSGFEKVGSLGISLPANDKQTTTQSGDIVLYNGNQIVIFYGSNSWSYTRLGKIDHLSDWEEALGSGDVTVTFSLE